MFLDIVDMKKILLTGGGSGGHIFPLLAITEELIPPFIKGVSEGRGISQEGVRENKKLGGVKLVYFGDAGKFTDYFRKENISIKHITSAKLRRYFSWRNFIDIPKFIWSFFQAFFKVFQFKPDVAFSKGGATALPVVFACWILRVPIIIHESDAIPGLANTISARFAKKIFLSFVGAKKYLPKGEVVGNPIRSVIASSAKQSFVNQSYEVELRKINMKPLILVLGGSQGATRLNQLISSIIARSRATKQSLSCDFKIAHQLEAKELAKLLTISDLVISRSGAGAIFEIAAFGKPSILIPLPESARDHQRANAYEYAKTGAAEVLEESPSAISLEDKLLQIIHQILTDKKKYQQMSKAALAFAKPNATKKIANNIIHCG